MTNKHGDFIWYELLTSDANAAGDFYGKVVGWTSTNSGQPGMDYRFFSSGDGTDNNDGVGGYMAITPDMAAGGAKPAWVGYIGVDDVDASTKSIADAGGSVLMPAMDLDGVGRMAMVADPQGAPFYVMKGASDETSYSFAALAPKVGHCAWNELSTSDPESAKAFYTALFGWSKQGEMDMGPMGKYEFLMASGERFGIGAVMPKMPDMSVSMWAYYFRVPDIDAGAAAITANGGTLLQEPIEIPGGDYSLMALDPAGAAFGLVGART
ncbi:MAG: VOC family protein [Chakrabartia sp.]